MRTPVTQSEIVVGLDLGSTKVSAVVGEVDADGITILGVGNVPCRGLRKGVVSNIEWTVRSIREAVDAAETMAGVEIQTVYAGVAGAHIRSHVSDGVAAISGREVTITDLERVLEGARAIPVDADRMILHALPREYIVDNQDGVRDPIGMSGVRLQVRVNLITAASSCVQNVMRCVERCGLEVADIVLEPLASADAVLSDDEKEIGVGVIDIGGGTTDLLVYADGGIAHTSVIDRKSTRLNSSHTVIYTLSLHDALPISLRRRERDRRRGHRHRRRHHRSPGLCRRRHRPHQRHRSEEHTSELQSHSDLHSFPTRRSSDLSPTTRKRSASGSSTSAAAPPISWSMPTAASPTPAS